MTKARKLITVAIAAVTLGVTALGAMPSLAGDYNSFRHGGGHEYRYGGSHYDHNYGGRDRWSYYSDYNPWYYYYGEYGHRE